MKKKILIILGSLVLLTAFMSVAQAYQIPDEFKPQNLPFGEKEIDYSNDTYFQTAGSSATVIILQTIAGALLYFAAPLAIILITMSAFNMTMGGADSEKLEQSKKHLTWTIIGLFLIILSYSLVKIIIVFVTQAADVAN